MKFYKLSVRLMTYNHGNYIEEALKGINKQKTNFSFEVVVGDDFSTDNTLSKIREYDFINPNLNLKILDRKVGDAYHKKRLKNGRLYNFVDILNNCAGEYIALLDGDDYWTDPLKLQKQVDFLEENKDYSLCFHPVRILNQKGEYLDDFITAVPLNHECMESLARYGNYIHTPSVVFRNSLKKYPFEFLNAPFGDYFLYMMLSQEVGKIKYFPEVMAVYRHGVGIISKRSEFVLANDNIQLYSCMISYVQEEEIKKILLQRQTEVLLKYHNQLQKKYQGAFVTEHFLFQKIKILQTTFRRFRTKRK